MNKKIVYSLCLLFIAIGIVFGFNNYKIIGSVPKNNIANYRYLIEVNGKYGYINRWGKEVIPPKYDYGNDFSEGLAAVCKEKEPTQKCGYIDINGKVVIPFKFNSANTFSEGVAVIVQDNKYKYINKFGEVINNNNKFLKDFIPLEKDNKYGYVDKKGNYLIKPQFDGAEDFSEGLAFVWYETKLSPTVIKSSGGFINKRGEFVIKLNSIQHWYAHIFSDGLAVVGEDCKYIDKTGKVVLDPSKFNLAFTCRGFKEGLVPVGYGITENGYKGWGYMNKKGVLVIKTNAKVYDEDDPPLDNFHEGLAKISQFDNYGNEQYGFIDKKGKYVVNPILFHMNRDNNSFYYSNEFKNGLTAVKTRNLST